MPTQPEVWPQRDSWPPTLVRLGSSSSSSKSKKRTASGSRPRDDDEPRPLLADIDDNPLTYFLTPPPSGAADMDVDMPDDDGDLDFDAGIEDAAHPREPVRSVSRRTRSAHCGSGISPSGTLVWYQSWLVAVAESLTMEYRGAGGFSAGLGRWTTRPVVVSLALSVVRFAKGKGRSRRTGDGVGRCLVFAGVQTRAFFYRVTRDAAHAAAEVHLERLRHEWRGDDASRHSLLAVWPNLHAISI